MRVLSDVTTVDLADRIYITGENESGQEGPNTHIDVYIGIQDAANTIYGTTGNDLVFGGSKFDILYTRGGRAANDNWVFARRAA